MENEKKFNDLGLSENSLKAISIKGFEEPTKIQVMTIPVILKNDSNIIAQAQTGTGKTAAFALPLVELIDDNSKNVQALVLVPTRELAIQVSEEINSLKGEKNIKVIPIYGGQSIDQQLRRLKKYPNIIVGTPGRIIDHLNRKTLKLNEINYLVLDEADEMLNMGFIDDIEKIMKYTNVDKKTFLFSATMPPKIKDLAKKYIKNYQLIKVPKEQLTTNLTEQIYFEVKSSDKFEALCRIIDVENNFYGIIFCRTKSDVDYVVNHLIDRGYDAEAIHGDISQAQRERSLNKFKKKNINILVATDVAARGIDVYNISHVINYSLPQDAESYIHRIGRTGRAGNEGTAITFITPNEYRGLMYIQKFAKADIRKSKLPLVKDIIESKKNKIQNDINRIIEKSEVDSLYHEFAKDILKNNNSETVLASVLNYCFHDELNPSSYGDIKEVEKREKSREISFQLDKEGKTRLFVALGRENKINANKIVDLITNKVALHPKQIRDIQVFNKFSFVTVPFDKVDQILVSFKQKGKKPLITPAKNK